MAILHLVQYSLPEIVSGYTLRTQAVVTEQRALGLDPLVLTSPRHPSSEERALEGVPYLRCQPEPKTGVVWLRDARRVRWLAQRVISVARARGDIALLHAHSPLLCGVAALRAGRELGLPVVYEIRGLWEEAMRRHSPRYHLARAMETKLCRRADAVVAISQGLREEFVGRGVAEDKVHVVPNGVDLVRFDPETAPRDWRERRGFGSEPLLLYLGALRDYEGVDLILEALPRITARHPEARLIIAGGGEARERIAGAAQAAGEQARLLSPVPHAETPAVYAAADLVLYPRRATRATERVAPLKPLEAMAMGRAILASDVGGLRELLTDGETARLFPAGLAEALAKIAGELLDDAPQRERLGAAARAEARGSFGWPRVVSGYLRVYERLGLRVPDDAPA